MTKTETLQLKLTATRVRMGIIEATHGAGCGHPGGSLSAADVMTYLYFREMRIDPQNPQWEDRDKLVMSKGHVVMEGTPKEVFSQTEKVRSLHLDVPQAAELRDELVKAGIPMPEGIIDTGECAQALYELLQ